MDFDIKMAPVHRSGINAMSVSVGAHDDRTARNFSDIRTLIENCPLSETIKSISLQIINRLATSEAHIHSCFVEGARFHEVGVIDAIVDILGPSIVWIIRESKKPLLLTSLWERELLPAVMAIPL